MQEHQTLQDQTNSLATSQTRLLDGLREELRRTLSTASNLRSLQSTKSRPDVSAIRSLTGSDFSVTNPSQPAMVALRLTEYQQKGYKCSCHRRKRARTPSFLSHVFGSLFVGYVGIPGFFTKCNLRSSCCQEAAAKGSITYMFPLWLVALVIMTRIEHSQRKGPEMLLRCLRVIPISANSVQAIFQGQRNTLATLIMTGKASILDVSDTGRSLLWVSRIAQSCPNCYPSMC